jgi:CRP/FNR family transcriptional regulator
MASASINTARDRKVGSPARAGFKARIEPSLPMPAAPSRLRRTLAANEVLFGRGDRRTHVFRVESGTICLYESLRSDRQTVIEFMFPGEYVGLGFLEEHSLTARALLGSTVTCIPVEEIDDVIKDDLRAQAKLATAIEREFDARREELSKAGQHRPIERVAALLVTAAHINAQEGRTMDLIDNSWRSDHIADQLGIDLTDLTAILVELERQGLIEATREGLRLNDIDALEAVADGQRSARPTQVRRPLPTRFAPCHQAA